MKPTKVFFDILQAYKDGFHTIACRGSARSGKTRGIIQFLDFVADQSAKHRKISIGSQSFPHLRDGAIYEYQKHMMEEKIVRQHNKSDHEFHINQSIVNYFSCDDPTKVIGPDKDIQYLNELNNGITFDTYNSLKIRTKELTLFDWNPAGEFFIHEKKLLEDDGVKVLSSTWLDNIENLTKHQIDFFVRAKKLSMKSDYWRYWWAVYGEGKDAVLLEERIMPMISKCKHVPEDAVEIPSALDFGFFPDPTVFLRLFIKKGLLRDTLYIKQIVYNQKLSINTKSEGATNLVDLLLAKGVNPKHKIIADCADPRSINELRNAKFNVEAVVKSAIETSIRLFHDYDIVFVEDGDNNSQDAYREFDNFKYDKNKKGTILGVPAKGQADHSIDGTRYVLLSRNSRWSLR